MKKFTFTAVLALLIVSVFAQQMKYSKVKIYADEQGLAQLANDGIDVTEGILKRGAFLITDLSEFEIDKIQEKGINFEILIDDVSKFYADRNIGKSTSIADYKDPGDWQVPENFEFGSMGGHCTFDEVVYHLDKMHNLFPDLISAKESIGQSIEGRELWMVKISDNPEVNEEEPEVLYTGLHHAREPASMMQLLFYMYYLLENYDTDPNMKALVDHTEMYFVPVVNPDGYVYNETTNPNGGGMWRKNRKINSGTSCMGVDPNRNYGYQWGYDNSGSSPDPCDATYRGEAAFSEPEVIAMRDFANNHEFRLALNYHTYSNLLLYPWGWTSDPSPDEELMNTYAEMMTQDSHYTYGASSTTIYPTNGDANDWMYGEQTTKGKILSFTPELGGGDDGFYCSIDRIIPIAQENMIQDVLLAAFAGKFLVANDETPIILSEKNGYIKFEAQRLGLEDGGTYTVSLVPVSDNIISVGDPMEYVGLNMFEMHNDSIAYELNPSVSGGTEVKFLLTVNNGEYEISDTLTKVYGQAVAIFEDDCNSTINWSGGWSTITSSYHSPSASITDSPGGDYGNNETNIITLNDEIDLTTAGYAQLNFWTKWEIEAGWDYVQVEVSANGGSTWIPIEGKFTKSGNSNQATGEPLYDGFQTDWVNEEINLNEYIGSGIKIRFKLVSDGYVTEDGFYFDDVQVMIIDMNTGVANIEQPVVLSNPVPNPASSTVRFNYSVRNTIDNLTLSVYNAIGEKVWSTPLTNGKQSVSASVEGWMPGIYYYRIEGTSYNSEAKKLLVK